MLLNKSCCFILIFSCFGFVLADFPHFLPVLPIYPKDASLSVPEIILRHGYPSESHTVETEDGYILTVYRIPRGKGQKPGGPPRPPVLYLHGIMDSAAQMVVFGPQRGQGFLLADAGYDVWLGNFRGTADSRAHKSLMISDPRYWDFGGSTTFVGNLSSVAYKGLLVALVCKKNDSLSFNITTVNWAVMISDPRYWDFGMDELAAYDIPALIDYVLFTTGQSKLSYLGYSMGNLCWFMTIASKPEYNDKVNVMFAEGPTTFVGNLSSVAYKGVLVALTTFWRVRPAEVFPFDKTMRYLVSIICSLPEPAVVTASLKALSLFTPINKDLCTNPLLITLGWTTRGFDKEARMKITAVAPADTSRRILVQSFQLIFSGHFQKFDFGFAQNLLKYGQLTPPQYDTRNVRVPLILIHGTMDRMSVDKDIQHLKENLRPDNQPLVIQLPGANHMDYLYDPQTSKIIIQYLDKYNKKADSDDGLTISLKF